MAILGTSACFDVHDRAEMDFIAFVVFPDPVRPGHQIKNIGRLSQAKQKQSIVPLQGIPIYYPFSELGNPIMI